MELRCYPTDVEMQEAYPLGLSYLETLFTIPVVNNMRYWRLAESVVAILEIGLALKDFPIFFNQGDSVDKPLWEHLGFKSHEDGWEIASHQALTHAESLGTNKGLRITVLLRGRGRRKAELCGCFHVIVPFVLGSWM